MIATWFCLGSRFIHLFIFKNAAAQAWHGESEAVKRFESIYSPELVGGDVVFTDYEMVAGKLGSELQSSPQLLRAE